VYLNCRPQADDQEAHTFLNDNGVPHMNSYFHPACLIIELVDDDALDIGRSRQAEQDVLDILDEDQTRRSLDG